jgi:protein OS-9
LCSSQFEIVYSDDFISETDALAILESSRTRDAVYTADPAQSGLTSRVRESAAAEISGTKSSDGSGLGSAEEGEDEDAPIAETYELITSPPFRYLCSVPVIAPPPALNRTATELAKAEEARENSRASAKGWELMSVLDGHCMYFTAGWWSYSFCYGKNVVQFHALASTRPGEPPTRDQKSQEYILGRVQKPPPSQSPADNADPDAQTKSLVPPNAQLQVKGDQRYLSQRLEDGTVCDLTGRPRTIEIQYHCSPGSTADRIGWIKEVTTCTYLMVVYTPRLCSDVAFQPPKETRAHPVRCRPVLRSEDEQSLWRRQRNNLLGSSGQKPFQSLKEATAAAGGTLPQNYLVGATIGGVVVGAKKYVSDEHADKLTLPRGLSRQPGSGSSGTGPAVEILASKKKDSTKIEVMSDEELKKRNLDPETVREFREEMEAFAGDRGWKLKLVGTDDQAQYIGSFDDEEGGDGVGGDGEGQKKQGSPAKGQKEGKGKSDARQPAQAEGEEDEGSQEVFFKEEL